MKGKILYTESQKYTQWWLWLIILGLNGFFLVELIINRLNPSNIQNTEDFYGILVGLIVSFSVTFLIYSIKLRTYITEDGIYIQFFPFHFSFRLYSWDQISMLNIRNYSAIVEYGGWGIRYSLSGNGVAYNISGNIGLQLVLKNNKKILIGTNNPEELKNILLSIHKYPLNNN